MATPVIFTLFLILSSVFSILTPPTIAHHPPNSKHSKPTSNFIWSSCLATQYPALCYHCLSGYASKIGRSHHKLALTALAVSLSRARSTARFVSQMKKIKGIKHRELEAVKDCIDTMGDSVDQLSHSIQELANLGHTNGEDFMWHISNVQTWVSSALTDENTCVDGLSDEHVKGGKIKAAIQKKVNNVAHVTSNALALVNRFVSSKQLAKDVKIP